ncbi:hypothetical protein ACFLWU_04150 [Chloroflexota bacterium]
MQLEFLIVLLISIPVILFPPVLVWGIYATIKDVRKRKAGQEKERKMRTNRSTEGGQMGVYLNMANGEFVQLGENSPLLSGTSDIKYIKVPAALALIVSPFVGLAFIIFLPFAGIAGFISYLGYWLWRGIMATERWTLQLAAVNRVQGQANFTSHGGTHAKNPKDKPGKE